MAAHFIARETEEIVKLVSLTKYIPDHHVPIYLEDTRARLNFIGLNLEDVVRAGIYRLGHVPARIAKWAQDEGAPRAHLATDNWAGEIQFALDFHGEKLSWSCRTFLKVLLTKTELLPQELTRANSILDWLWRHLDEDEEEALLKSTEPPLPDQLDLDI